MAFKAAPLPHEWMITSIIGFFISLFLIYPEFSAKWGFTFMLFFGILFVASLVGINDATTDHEDLNILAVHYKRK